jgi:uncharacterized protein (DUF305 family)
VRTNVDPDTAAVADGEVTVPEDLGPAGPGGDGVRRTGRWWRRAALVVLACLAVLVGYAVRVDVEVASRPGDASAEAGFARDMSAHHAQAVEMALLAYATAELPATRTMAYAIATSQQAQIGIMDTWLTDWHLNLTSTGQRMAWMSDGMSMLTPDGRMPGMASDADLDRLRSATGKQVDILFCQLMTAHHLGGITMIDGILTRTHNPQVLALARLMKANQQADIASMQDLLTRARALPAQPG